MELLITLSIAAIMIASIVWYKAKVFISEHVKKYNSYLHYIDFKLLKELKKHDQAVISEKAQKHHRNIKISAIVIIISILILLAQRVY